MRGSITGFYGRQSCGQFLYHISLWKSKEDIGGEETIIVNPAVVLVNEFFVVFEISASEHLQESERFWISIVEVLNWFQGYDVVEFEAGRKVDRGLQEAKGYRPGFFTGSSLRCETLEGSKEERVKLPITIYQAPPLFRREGAGETYSSSPAFSATPAICR
jgi:hypothetical protein